MLWFLFFCFLVCWVSFLTFFFPLIFSIRLYLLLIFWCCRSWFRKLFLARFEINRLFWFLLILFVSLTTLLGLFGRFERFPGTFCIFEFSVCLEIERNFTRLPHIAIPSANMADSFFLNNWRSPRLTTDLLHIFIHIYLLILIQHLILYPSIFRHFFEFLFLTELIFLSKVEFALIEILPILWIFLW